VVGFDEAVVVSVCAILDDEAHFTLCRASQLRLDRQRWNRYPALARSVTCQRGGAYTTDGSRIVDPILTLGRSPCPSN